jgi:hypothetical protein
MKSLLCTLMMEAVHSSETLIDSYLQLEEQTASIVSTMFSQAVGRDSLKCHDLLQGCG